MLWEIVILLVLSTFAVTRAAGEAVVCTAAKTGRASEARMDRTANRANRREELKRRISLH
jgi:hypothetical protein